MKMPLRFFLIFAILICTYQACPTRCKCSSCVTACKVLQCESLPEGYHASIKSAHIEMYGILCHSVYRTLYNIQQHSFTRITLYGSPCLNLDNCLYVYEKVLLLSVTIYVSKTKLARQKGIVYMLVCFFQIQSNSKTKTLCNKTCGKKNTVRENLTQYYTIWN